MICSILDDAKHDAAGMLWASAYDNRVGPKKSGAQVKQSLTLAKGSRLVVLDVGQQAVSHAEQFLTRRHRSSNYSGDIESYKRATRRARFTPGDCAAECMWWLTNLETGPGQNVMQLLDGRGPLPLRRETETGSGAGGGARANLLLPTPLKLARPTERARGACPIPQLPEAASCRASVP